MEVLPELLKKVFPYYGFILIGFFCARKWKLESKWISKLLLFVFIPLLIIEKMLQADLKETAVAGTMIFVLAMLMNLPAIWGRKIARDNIDPSITSVSYSYYNIGWFGIPVVTALFGEEKLALVISAYIGNALYGDTVGYYLASRSKGISAAQAFAKIFKIPAIYAAAVGIGLNAAGVELPEAAKTAGTVAGWLVSASGMLIIGITLAGVKFKNIAWKMFSKLISIRYISGALILALLVLAESFWPAILEPDQQKIMLLLASFPIAANLVVFATVLETEEENAALLVGITSMVSLVLVPVVCLLLF
ncbi:MAG: AEC family transporter [Flavitalea sp.]